MIHPLSILLASLAPQTSRPLHGLRNLNTSSAPLQTPQTYSAEDPAIYLLSFESADPLHLFIPFSPTEDTQKTIAGIPAQVVETFSAK